MNRLHQLEIHVLLLVSIVFICLIGGRTWIFLGNVNRDARGAGVALNQVNTALAKVNQPCMPVKGQKLTLADSKDCGTLADVNRMLQTARGTMGTLETAGRHWDKNLDTLDVQEATLFTNARDLLVASTGTANAATKTLHGASLDLSTLNDSIAATKPLLEASTAAVSDVDRFINQPALAATVGNLQTTTGEFAKTSTDFQNKFHALLYPPPCKGRMCWAIKAWPIIKGGGELAEPGYFALEFGKALLHH